MSDLLENFRWLPTVGPNPIALARLCQAFPQPPDPMGEAWFMGEERSLFDRLMDQDPTTMALGRLTSALEAVISGTSAFGEMEEWYDWYFYLLGRLVPRAYEYGDSGYLVEYLVSGLASQYPDGIECEPYQGFLGDSLTTLGQCCMGRGLWHNGKIRVGQSLLQRRRKNDKYNGRTRLWGWQSASGDLSSQIFLCLKYLPRESVAPWVRTFLAIPCPHWRAQIMVWLIGANRFLLGEVTQIDELTAFRGPKPRIDWAWSHCLKGRLHYDREGNRHLSGFVSDGNLTAFRTALAEELSAAVFDSWVESWQGVDYLAVELQDMPARFRSLYLP